MQNGKPVQVMQPPMGGRMPIDGETQTVGLTPGQAPPPYAPVAPTAPAAQAGGAPWSGGAPAWAAPPAATKPPLTERIGAEQVAVLQQGVQHLANTGAAPGEVLTFFPTLDIDDLREVARSLGLEEKIRWDAAAQPVPVPVTENTNTGPTSSSAGASTSTSTSASTNKRISKKRDYPLIKEMLGERLDPEVIAEKLGLKVDSVKKAIEEITAEAGGEGAGAGATGAATTPTTQPVDTRQMPLPHTQQNAPQVAPTQPAPSSPSVERSLMALTSVQALAQHTGLTLLEIEAAAALLGVQSV